MSTIKALLITGEDEVGVRDVPIPFVPEKALLVKVKAVAINPTDWKYVHYKVGDIGSRCGCDFAGIVEEVGPGVTEYQKGDRVAGYAHGG